MSKYIYRILPVLLLQVLLISTNTPAQTVLKSGVMGNSSSAAGSAGYQIKGTAGQVFTGSAGNSANTVEGGFWYQAEELITGIEALEELPKTFRLEQNYPNPFNPSTTLQFAIPKREKVVLHLFDVLGRHLATLLNEEKEAGIYKLNFDGRNLPSGVYFYRIQAGQFSQTRKMLLVK